MKTNIKPYLLLFCLLSIVLFLAGFRYGRKVEQLDKKYVQPTKIISPTKALNPTSKPVGFRSYNSLPCKVSFLIADDFKKMTDDDSELLSNKIQSIIINCQQKEIRKTMIDYEDATPSAQYKLTGQKVNVYEMTKNKSLWTVKNPFNQELILFVADNNLIPIIIKTIEFSQPLNTTPTNTP